MPNPLSNAINNTSLTPTQKFLQQPSQTSNPNGAFAIIDETLQNYRAGKRNPSDPKIKSNLGAAIVFKEKDGYNDLRYPFELLDDDHDYMKFSVYEYKRPYRKRGENVSFNDSVEIVEEKMSLKKTDIEDRNDSLVAKSDTELAGNLLGQILLPIPSQINDTNNTNYGEKGLNFMEQAAATTVSNMLGSQDPSEGMTELFKGLQNQDINNLRTAIKSYTASQALKALGVNLSINDILARSSGSILNPNMELLFTGPTLRQFKFQFKFTPRSWEEGQRVKKIIRVFKKCMSPRGVTGDFLKTPHIFKLQYMKGGSQHPFLNKLKHCALTSMNVNYTGDGTYATYWDGTPISLTMDLSFQELTPIYNEDYDYTNNSLDGVGY